MTDTESRPQPFFEHRALLYSGMDEYVQSVLAFIGEGIKEAVPAMVAVPESRLGRLREEIGRVFSPPASIHYVNMTKLGRNPARIIPAVTEFLSGQPARQVRLVSEAAWPERDDEERAEIISHEALMDQAFRGCDVFALCLYARDQTPDYLLERVERTHPALEYAGRRRASPDFGLAAVLAEQADAPLPPPPDPHGVRELQFGDLGLVRSFVRSEAMRRGLGDDAVDDLVLSVNEAATNSILHGGGRGTLRMWSTPAAVWSEVSDRGWLTDPLAGRHPPGPGLEAHGLWLINQLCDLVQLRSAPGRTTVRMRVDLPPL